MTESFSNLHAKIANAAVTSGLCKCEQEPKGDKGLEGYIKCDSYKWERVFADVNGRPYFRVFPTTNFPSYYETCGEATFHKYFTITEVSK